MKVILDVPEEDMAQGLTQVLITIAQNPTQEVGKENGISVDVNGNRYLVIKNLNSYTLK